MSKRPEVPKRLASRIRAAQERVLQKRLAVAASEHTLRRSLERVAEYERSPEAFAARYYRGHDADSYPVQTTIARERERIEYHEDRKPTARTKRCTIGGSVGARPVCSRE